MANNQNVNKVVYGNQTLIDITDTTAEENTVADGEVFYKASGARSVGTFKNVDPATATPIMDGVGAVGTSAKYAREDHVHPSDTTRAAATDVPTQASIDEDGLITYKNSSGATLFTLQLPIYEPPVVSNYTVTVSLTNPHSAGDFSACNIYEMETDDYAATIATTPIGTINNPEGYVTVSVSSQAYGVLVDVYGSFMSSSFMSTTCSGGVSCIKREMYDGYEVDFDQSDSNNMYFKLAVVGDGAIAIDGIDYDD